MEFETCARLAPMIEPLELGDEVHCPHCQQWHPVVQLYADRSTAEKHHLYARCPGHLGWHIYFVGILGAASRWPSRRAVTI
jgi:hypothetical protein